MSCSAETWTPPALVEEVEATPTRRTKSVVATLVLASTYFTLRQPGTVEPRRRKPRAKHREHRLRSRGGAAAGGGSVGRRRGHTRWNSPVGTRLRPTGSCRSWQSRGRGLASSRRPARRRCCRTGRALTSRRARPASSRTSQRTAGRPQRRRQCSVSAGCRRRRSRRCSILSASRPWRWRRSRSSGSWSGRG